MIILKLEWEIVENNMDSFKVKVKNVPTAFGKQTILFTIKPDPNYEMSILSKSLDGKPYGSETVKVAEYVEKLAKKHWIRFAKSHNT